MSSLQSSEAIISQISSFTLEMGMSKLAGQISETAQVSSCHLDRLEKSFSFSSTEWQLCHLQDLPVFH